MSMLACAKLRLCSARSLFALLVGIAVAAAAQAAQPPSVVPPAYKENSPITPGFGVTGVCDTKTLTTIAGAETDCDVTTSAFVSTDPCGFSHFQNLAWMGPSGGVGTNQVPYWTSTVQRQQTINGAGCNPQGTGPWTTLGTAQINGVCPSGYVLGWGLKDAFGSAHGDQCLTQENIKERDPGCPLCHAGDPIDPSSGNNFQAVTDYRGTGPFPLVFTRTYNSLLAIEIHSASNYSTNENLGVGWTTSAGGHLFATQMPPNPLPCIDTATNIIYTCMDSVIGTAPLQVTIWHADGGQDWFTLQNPPSPLAAGIVFPNQQLAKGALVTVNLSPPYSGVGFLYTRNDGYKELYDGGGNLLVVTNPGGLSQSYHYNAGGQLTAITDPAGRQLTFTYDTSGRVSTMTNPAGGVYTYTYDTFSRLSTVKYPDNSVLTYVWNSLNSAKFTLVGITDENNSSFATWGYDSTTLKATSAYNGVSTLKANNVTIHYNTDGSADVTEPNALVRHLTFTNINGKDLLSTESQPCVDCSEKYQSFSYDANGFLTSETDFDGNVTQFTHDASGLETSRTEAYGTADARTISTTWDPVLRQPTHIAEPGRTTDYTYDTVGRMLTKTVTDTATSVARTTTYTYNTQGLLANVDGPRTDVGDVTTYGYTTSGDLNSITNALGQVTQITTRDLNGYPTTIIDPNGVTTTLTYDARQRLLTKTVNGVETTSFTYDLAGELTKVTLPDSSFLQYAYDTAHRVTSVTDNLGNKLVYTLDKLGNRTTEQTKDTGGTVRRTMSRVYDSLNNLQKTIGGQSQTTVYTNDNMGNPTTVTDPMTNATTQVFDALNRLQSVTDPASGVTTYNENALDQTTDVTDPRGLNTHYDYDAFGDLTEQDSPDTGATTYTYDLAGNRLTKTDAASITATYTYDALNRLTSISYPDTSKNVTYTYDAGTYGKGHLTGIADASGTTSYTYDAYGNLIQKVAVEGGHTFTVGYSYDLANRLSSITYPDGMVVTYTRNSIGQITGVTENSSSVASSITYKPFGPISGLTYGNGLVETRTYDQDYRLTGISIPAVQGLTFGYNANDDVTGITDSIRTANTQTLGYDNLNRLTTATSGTGGYGSQTYTYDADGNRTSLINSAGTSTYTLDTVSNQLQSISGAVSITYAYNAMGALDSDGTNQNTYADTERLDTVTNISTSATVASYVYNGLGQRTGKTTSAGTSLFVYDEEGKLLGEYDGSGNLVQEHIWLADRPIGVVNSTTLYYVQTDQLGVPRIVTDSSHATVWVWNSDPFGNATPTGSLTYNLRLPGQYFDSETGHIYNYYRDYDLGTGRYIESDLVGIESDLNTYRYVLDNPVGLIDPYGLYKVKGAQVPDPWAVNLSLWVFIVCTENCMREQLTITATTNDHTTGAHARGTGIDFTLPEGGSGANKAICCAEKCGAMYVQDEYHYPSPHATGPHIHAQLDPGAGGARGTGRHPQPKCDKCNGG